MQVREHKEVAQEFLQAADHYFAVGDKLQGSEKLWGAASHALLVLTTERGWRDNTHAAMKRAVESLSTEHNDPTIWGGYALAEKFHRNFYHGFLEDYEIEIDGPKVRDFVVRILALAENGAAQE